MLCRDWWMWLCDFHIRIILNSEYERERGERKRNAHFVPTNSMGKERMILWVVVTLGWCTRPIHERTKRATTLRENWLHIWIWNKYIYMNMNARIIAIIVTVKAISLCRCLGFMSDNNAFCCALFISLFASLSQSPSVPIHKRCCLQCSNVCVFIHCVYCINTVKYSCFFNVKQKSWSKSSISARCLMLN